MQFSLLKKVFTPSWLEVTFYVLFNFLVLGALNVSLIVTKVTESSNVDKAAFSSSISDQIGVVGSSPIVKIATIVIFWSIVGLAVYTLFWMALNFFTGLKNEVVIETDYVNKGGFFERVGTPLIKFASVIGVLLLIGLSMRLGYPIWNDLIRNFVGHLDSIDLQTSVLLVVGFVAACLNTYIVTSVAKLIWTEE